MRASRSAAERRGRRAETLAALWLMAKGYRILAQRARTPFGEVDIVAMRGGVFVVVEVKARRRLEQAFEAISPQAQLRIARAGETLAQRFGLQRAPMRFDLVALAPGRLPRHIRDAWRMEVGLTLGQRG